MKEKWLKILDLILWEMFLIYNLIILEWILWKIKMAKNQQLSLNPSKISGICGKLLCCLKYENETYVELMKRLPDVGNRVLTELGEGRVRSINMIAETVIVEYKDTIRKHDASEILKILDRKVKKDDHKIDPELKQLMD